MKNMKKSIALLLISLLVVFLRGTAFAEPRFVALTQKYEGQNVVEIVGLKDNAKNAGADAFNEAVRSTVGRFYEDFTRRGAEEGEWVEITSYPIESKNYLQVVTRYIEYPNYGSDGDIASFVYDKRKKSLVKLADVLKQYGLDDEKLTEKAAKWFENYREGDESVMDAEASGFYIWESRDSNASDTLILLRVSINDPDTTPWTYFYSYSPKSDAENWAKNPLEKMRPKNLFSRYNVVEMTPPLRVNQDKF